VPRFATIHADYRVLGAARGRNRSSGWESAMTDEEPTPSGFLPQANGDTHGKPE
jgi:hypothetical protein